MQFLIALACIALAVFGYYLYCKHVWGDVSIPMPAMLRTDLHFCYYLSMPGQMVQVADHTDLCWYAQFYKPGQLRDELAGHAHGLVVDCTPQLFTYSDKAQYVASDTARASIAAFFAELHSLGLLSRVRYLVTIDEPNINCASEDELRQALSILKAEAAQWPELAGVQYLCIYGEKANKLWCLDQFDIVGVDCYSQRSETLTRGSHADLMRALLPHQQALVIPGAAYGQDPAPFVAYAHANPRVWGVVPFIWSHVSSSADKEAWTGLEKQGTEAQERYRQAGLQTLARQQQQPDPTGFFMPGEAHDA